MQPIYAKEDVMQYAFFQDFGYSLKKLYEKAGPFRKAADTVLAMQQKARDGYTHKAVFAVAITHSGENRIPHCVKYDLTARARLVTVVNNGFCMFLFAGDHETVDRWIEKNRNIDFIAKQQDGAHVIEPVYESTQATASGLIRTGNDLGAPDQLLDLISERYRKKLLWKLSLEVLTEIRGIGPTASDADIIHTVDMISDEGQKMAILDVLLKLREGDGNGAKNRIDLYSGEAKKLSDLTKKEAFEIQSGEQVVKVQDIDPFLFEHFVKTADYQKWMLYLHPGQRKFVDEDFTGSMRLSGVSGSGKTCVLIHRALRMAEKYPNGKILVLTLNAALANLIESLIRASRGKSRPRNLLVRSFWEVCREKVLNIEPNNARLYTHETIASNPYAVSEHIDDIWDEYYNCRNNNNHAELMFPLHRSLLTRRIYPKDYLKQEFDYLRSAFAPWERKKYLEMERTGRAVALDQPFRNQVLDGLQGWEKKMQFVGAIDSTGIATALYKHIDKLRSDYRCILVDEVQDFGTLELAIIRKLAAEDENDLFLCGDAAQSVYTKYHDFEAAKINVKAGRSARLQQNYRNSRQILIAAHEVLSRNFALHSKNMTNLEIFPPEFANFSSPKPLLLEASSLSEEAEFALVYAKSLIADDARKRVCMAFVGYHQRSIEEIGSMLKIPTLNGDMNIDDAQLFISDLEQTKGFEFDTMIILNAHSDVLPQPDLPQEESFRDLSKFYVAMTRAKLELIISFHGTVTSFIGEHVEHFVRDNWSVYAERIPFNNNGLPEPNAAQKRIGAGLEIVGKEFLRMPEAIGLPINAQEKLLKHVTGKPSFVTEGKRKRQMTWSNLGQFLNDMQQPINRTAISLVDETWQTIMAHFEIQVGV